MSWIFLAILALGFVTAQTLYYRIAGRAGVSPGFTILIAYSMTSAAAFVVVFFSRQTFVISGWPLVVTIVSAAGGSLVASVAAATSFKIAPNPGYAMSVINVYSLISLVGSAFLFKDQISLHKLVGVVIVVLTCGLVGYEKKSGNNSDFHWLKTSLVAALGFGGLALGSRFVLNSGTESPLLLGYICAIDCGILLFKTRVAEAKRQLALISKMVIAGIVISSVGFNLGLFQAYKVAPNVGYVGAFVSGSAALVTLLSVLFFKDHLSLTKLVGVLGVIVGLTVMFI